MLQCLAGIRVDGFLVILKAPGRYQVGLGAEEPRKERSTRSYSFDSISRLSELFGRWIKHTDCLHDYQSTC